MILISWWPQPLLWETTCMFWRFAVTSHNLYYYFQDDIERLLANSSDFVFFETDAELAFSLTSFFSTVFTVQRLCLFSTAEVSLVDENDALIDFNDPVSIISVELTIFSTCILIHSCACLSSFHSCSYELMVTRNASVSTWTILIQTTPSFHLRSLEPTTRSLKFFWLLAQVWNYENNEKV